jgi:hypothetical protein
VSNLALNSVWLVTVKSSMLRSRLWRRICRLAGGCEPNGSGTKAPLLFTVPTALPEVSRAKVLTQANCAWLRRLTSLLNL